MTFAINALMCQALQGSMEPFDEKLHLLKPHPGQITAASFMRTLLNGSKAVRGGRKSGSGLVQDRYSIRCIPQYFGPLLDGLETIIRQIELEINSADDNPLADVESKRFIQGGNFYGQYIGLAMDQLRQYVSLCAKQLDVQISLLVTPEFSQGLPASLSAGEGEALFGLKGLQIAGNSVLPRLLHLANPVVLLFPTHAEQFNQNINSQGFNASMMANDSMSLFRNYLGAALVFGVQGVELRSKQMGRGYNAMEILSPATRPLYLACYEVIGMRPSDARPLVYTGDRVSIESITDSIIRDMESPKSKILSSLDGCFSEDTRL